MIKKISIVIPTYNEKEYLSKCLDSIILSSDQQCDIEILIADGMSTDGTRNILRQYKNKYNFIKIVDNHKRYQSFALNILINIASGDLIIRCDAHCIYPHNYISELLKWHEKNIADNIGGCWENHPGSKTKIAESIAIATSTPIGVGISYRTISSNSEQFVDTVPFGSWRKNSFDKFGLFDEKFLRAQDLDHNMTIKENGGKILLLPWLKIQYYARSTWWKLIKMFFNTGYWKVKINKKHKKMSSVRQLIPFGFVLINLSLLTVAIFSLVGLKIFLFYNVFYFVSILFGALFYSLKNRRIDLTLHIAITYILSHFSYGAGYIKGIFDLIIHRNVKFKELNTR